jgi:hypothetical protein
MEDKFSKHVRIGCKTARLYATGKDPEIDHDTINFVGLKEDNLLLNTHSRAVVYGSLPERVDSYRESINAEPELIELLESVGPFGDARA